MYTVCNDASGLNHKEPVISIVIVSVCIALDCGQSYVPFILELHTVDIFSIGSE